MPLTAAFCASSQQDGALRNDILAERISLSAAPTLRRVRALQDAGIIQRYAALLDPERVGLAVRVKLDVRLSSQARERDRRILQGSLGHAGGC